MGKVLGNGGWLWRGLGGGGKLGEGVESCGKFIVTFSSSIFSFHLRLGGDFCEVFESCGVFLETGKI